MGTIPAGRSADPLGKWLGDRVGAAARFYKPFGLTTDGTSLDVADTFNDTIRKID